MVLGRRGVNYLHLFYVLTLWSAGMNRMSPAGWNASCRRSWSPSECSSEVYSESLETLELEMEYCGCIFVLQHL